MNGETLFDHAVPEASREPEGVTPDKAGETQAPSCATLRPGCGCDADETADENSRRGPGCAFAVWVADVAAQLAKSAPKNKDLPASATGRDLNPDGPLQFLISKKILGPHYESSTLAFPGFYAFHDVPSNQGVRLLSTLYSRAIDPEGDLGIDHRAGYRSEPGECIVGRYFAAGFREKGPSEAELAYAANHVDLRTLVCRTQADLERLYAKIVRATSQTPDSPGHRPLPKSAS